MALSATDFYSLPWSGRGNQHTAAALQAGAPQRRPQPGAERWLRPRTGSRGWEPPRRPRSHTFLYGCPKRCPRCEPQAGEASSRPLRSRNLPLSPPRQNRRRPGPRPYRTSCETASDRVNVLLYELRNDAVLQESFFKKKKNLAHHYCGYLNWAYFTFMDNICMF